MGFATSTPPVDHEPGAGVKGGIGLRWRVCTSRTPVIFRPLFSLCQAKAGRAAPIAPIMAPVIVFNIVRRFMVDHHIAFGTIRETRNV